MHKLSNVRSVSSNDKILNNAETYINLNPLMNKKYQSCFTTRVTEFLDFPKQLHKPKKILEKFPTQFLRKTVSTSTGKVLPSKLSITPSASDYLGRQCISEEDKFEQSILTPSELDAEMIRYKNDNIISDSDTEYRKEFTKELKLRTEFIKHRRTISTKISFRTPKITKADKFLPVSILKPSLFPNVPPYLTFSTHTEKAPLILPELHKILKFRFSKAMPMIVRQILKNSGCRIVEQTDRGWMGTWSNHMRSFHFKSLSPYQKMNHIPGSFGIGCKDSCWRSLKKNMLKYGKNEFGFMPETYILPYDVNALKKVWSKNRERNTKWILKPPASARGTGIKIINMWCQIPKRKPLIVQKYIERPLLINGSKLDLRLYVLVTSINPLRIYLHKDGLVRFASVQYNDRDDKLGERCMHLTNYSLNKHSSCYTKNAEIDGCNGHKWTVRTLWKYLETKNIDTEVLWSEISQLIIRTIMSGENTMNNFIKLNVSSRYNCYELFGFDILLDSDLVPWLLEVNISPSLNYDMPLDAHVKGTLIRAVLNTALYHLPPKLSKEMEKEICFRHCINNGICHDERMYVNHLSENEKLKHSKFTNSKIDNRTEYLNDILEFLTPDDVRCLVTTEDELDKCSPLERIFPTTETHSYLKYTAYPRYYNCLLDAWENRYGQNRQKGIEILRRHCEESYHLEVSPITNVKDSYSIREESSSESETEDAWEKKFPMSTRIHALNCQSTNYEIKKKFKI